MYILKYNISFFFYYFLSNMYIKVNRSFNFFRSFLTNNTIPLPFKKMVLQSLIIRTFILVLLLSHLFHISLGLAEFLTKSMSIINSSMELLFGRFNKTPIFIEPIKHWNSHTPFIEFETVRLLILLLYFTYFKYWEYLGKGDSRLQYTCEQSISNLTAQFYIFTN